MEKYNLTISLTDENKSDLVFLDLDLTEALAMIEMHSNEMLMCKIEAIRGENDEK